MSGGPLGKTTSTATGNSSATSAGSEAKSAQRSTTQSTGSAREANGNGTATGVAPSTATLGSGQKAQQTAAGTGGAASRTASLGSASSIHATTPKQGDSTVGAEKAKAGSTPSSTLGIPPKAGYAAAAAASLSAGRPSSAAPSESAASNGSRNGPGKDAPGKDVSSRSSSTDHHRRQNIAQTGPVSMARPNVVSPNLGSHTVNFGSTRSAAPTPTPGDSNPTSVPGSIPTSPALTGLGFPMSGASAPRPAGMNFGTVAASAGLANTTRPPGAASPLPPPPPPSAGSGTGTNTSSESATRAGPPAAAATAAAATAAPRPKANLANVFKGFSGGASKTSTPTPRPDSSMSERPVSETAEMGPRSGSGPQQKATSVGGPQPGPYGYRATSNGPNPSATSPSPLLPRQSSGQSIHAGPPTPSSQSGSHPLLPSHPPHFGAGMNMGMNMDQHRYSIGGQSGHPMNGTGPGGLPHHGNYSHMQSQHYPGQQGGYPGSPYQGPIQGSAYSQHAGHGPSAMINSPSMMSSTGSSSSTMPGNTQPSYGSTLPSSASYGPGHGQPQHHSANGGVGQSMHAPSNSYTGSISSLPSSTPGSSHGHGGPLPTQSSSAGLRSMGYSGSGSQSPALSRSSISSVAPSTGFRKSAAIRIFNPETKEEVDMSAITAASKAAPAQSAGAAGAAAAPPSGDKAVSQAPGAAAASGTPTRTQTPTVPSPVATPPLPAVISPSKPVVRKPIRIESEADRDARLKREAEERESQAKAAETAEVVEKATTNTPGVKIESPIVEPATVTPIPDKAKPEHEEGKAASAPAEAAAVEPLPPVESMTDKGETTASAPLDSTPVSKPAAPEPAIEPKVEPQELVKEERSLAIEEEKAAHPEESDGVASKKAQEAAAAAVDADLEIVDGHSEPKVPIKASGTEAPLKDDNDLTTVPEIEPIAKDTKAEVPQAEVPQAEASKHEAPESMIPDAKSSESQVTDESQAENPLQAEEGQEPAASEANSVPTAAQIDALKNARRISDFKDINYPASIQAPSLAKETAIPRKFIYDRAFLMQFMEIITQKPAGFPSPETLGMDDLMPPPSAGKMAGKRGPMSGASTPIRGSPVAPGPGGGAFGGAIGAFGQFAHPPRNSNERFIQSTVKMTQVPPVVRPVPTGRAAGDLGSARNASPAVIQQQQMQHQQQQQQQQQQMLQFQQMQQQQMQGRRGPRRAGGVGPPRGGPQPILTLPIDQVAPLQTSENRWKPMTLSGANRPALGAVANPDSPEMVQRKVKSLLNKLTVEKFESISNQVVEWANKSENEKDGRILRQVIQLVFEKATDEAHWSSMYAELCLKIQTQLKASIMDEAVTNKEGVHITGGGLFRKYLLNRCQEDFQRGWAAAGEAAAAAAEKSTEDQAKLAANKASADGDAEKEESETGTEAKKSEKKEAAILSDEYYVAAKAKRRGLGLIRFIGELFKFSMLTERIMHECIKKLLSNVSNPEEEEVESLTKLLSTIGKQLDTDKSRGLLDVYFQRLTEMSKNQNLNSRMQFMLLDVIELRKNGWHARREVGGPKTLDEIHADAERQRQNAELEKRALAANSRNRGRGGFGGPAPEGWTSVGQPQVPRKAGDLSRFGKMGGTSRSSTPGGPGGVFSMRGKNKSSGETSPANLSRSSSNANMFGMLGDGQEPTKEAGSPDQIKIEQPKPQRAKLELKPRTIPKEGEAESLPNEAAAASDDSDSVADEEMSKETADRKTENLLKEFWQIKDLEDAHDNVKELPLKYRVHMVEKLIEASLDRKENDAVAAADLLEVIAGAGTLSKVQLEEAFTPVVELVEDISIDAPSAYKFLGILLDGADMNEEDVTRISKPLEGLDGIVPPSEKLMKAFKQARESE